MSLELRNPHSAIATLKSRPQDVVEVRLQSSKPHGAWDEVVSLAARHRVPVVNARPPRGRQPKTGRTGVATVAVKEHPGVDLKTLYSDVEPNTPGLWLALDQLQDPHNVGAVFRTAAFFGIKGVLLTSDRSAPLSATVYDVASGGLEYVPFCVQTNLVRGLEIAKESGLWILGASEHAEQDVRDVDRGRPWLLVLGNEEKGLRKLTEKTCDEMCRLTPAGPIRSLNVSVAAGVLMAALTAGR